MLGEAAGLDQWGVRRGRAWEKGELCLPLQICLMLDRLIKAEMKYITHILVAAFLILSSLPVSAQESTIDTTPAISLFESIERIELFLKDEAKQNYDDKYLSGITLQYFEGHPRKGLAWVYSFSFKKPRLGGDVSIFHFMDGEIIEFHHGP